MFKIYSKGCEYAIRALSHIPLGQAKETFSAKTLCKKARIPESYTRKVFQSLVRAKFFSAISGPGGGYVLINDPHNISLFDIIKAVDGDEIFERCILGLTSCRANNPCPVHNIWKKMKFDMVDELKSQTLDKLMKTQIRQSQKKRKK